MTLYWSEWKLLEVCLGCTIAEKNSAWFREVRRNGFDLVLALGQGDQFAALWS